MASPSTPMRQLFSPLIEYGKITTTEAKAKILKRQMERLISRSKKLDLVTHRRVLSLLSGDKVAEKFLGQIVPQFKERVGGYVRVVKLPHRLGDHAPMARVEFVEEIKKDLGKSEQVGKDLPSEKKSLENKKNVITAAKRPARRSENVKNKSNKAK